MHLRQINTFAFSLNQTLIDKKRSILDLEGERFRAQFTRARGGSRHHFCDDSFFYKNVLKGDNAFVT